MGKSNFLLGVYDEFARKITWPKWAELRSSTKIVALSTLILAVLLYSVDEIFIQFLKVIFSTNF